MWPAEIAIQLRQSGLDAVAVIERPDLRGQPDDAIFQIASTENRAVVTENVVDFRPIAADWLRRGLMHGGLVFTTNRRYPRHDPRTAGRLVTALDTLAASRPVLTGVEFWLP